jgi:hypothetical protein
VFNRTGKASVRELQRGGSRDEWTRLEAPGNMLWATKKLAEAHTIFVRRSEVGAGPPGSKDRS